MTSIGIKINSILYIALKLSHNLLKNKVKVFAEPSSEKIFIIEKIVIKHGIKAKNPKTTAIIISAPHKELFVSILLP